MFLFSVKHKILKHVCLSLFIVFFVSACVVNKTSYDVVDVPFVDSGNSAWGPLEFKRISTALKDEKIPYTFSQDEKGKAVLQSIVNHDNLEFLRDKQAPWRGRLLGYVDFLTAYNEILILYAKRKGRDKSIHSELANLMNYALYIGEVGINLVNEFLPTIPKDDNYENRLAGLKQMYVLWTQIFVGSERSVHETKFYSSSDITLILTAMNDTLPTLKQSFPEGFNKALHDKLIAYHQNLQDRDAQLVEAMIGELKPN